MSTFLPFCEAVVFAQSLGLANMREWLVWCKEGMRPPDVPSHPESTYKDGGWQGWGHWLGTGNQRTKDFLPFAEALAVARSLNLASGNQWRLWCKEGMRPPDVPSHPEHTYKDAGWQGWGHWLGTGNQRTKDFLPFGEALAVARSLNLASGKQWRVWCKGGIRPPNVPANPHETYKDAGWQGWGHWLGSDLKPPQFLPFGKALAVTRSLGLVSWAEWKAWCKEGLRPACLPSTPDKIYKDSGWQGWGHWLGTGSQRRRTHEFLPFGEALAAARSLGLSGQSAWRTWCKEGARPPNVPSAPDKIYKASGWQGWGHWLATGNTLPSATEFLPFADALALVRSHGLDRQFEWRAWCKAGMRPPNVPSAPDRVYNDAGWQGWGHWLGAGNMAGGNPMFLPFGEAKRVASKLRLASLAEWRVWCRSGARPASVPANPDKVYVHDGWMGWEHWLHGCPVAAPAPAATLSGSKRPAPGCGGGGKRRKR